MAVHIDPLARVAEGAQLGQDVRIGPFCTVGPHAELGDGVELVSHAVVEGHTRIGARTVLRPFAVVGGPPQSLSYKGQPTRVEIGEDGYIGDHATVNRATAEGHGFTRVGHHVFMMINSHVGHDCTVGDHVVFANNAVLGGHCEIGNRVFLGGQCAVHQFTRIGDFAMVGGLSGAKDDLIPFGMSFGANGVTAELIGLNVVGLKRNGFSRSDLLAVRACYQALFLDHGTWDVRYAAAKATYSDHPVAGRIIAFIEAGKKRPIMKSAKRHDSVETGE